MKIILHIIILLVIVYNAEVRTEKLSKGPYSRFIEFPDGDGVMHKIDLEADPDAEILAQVENNNAHLKYFLFTRRNPFTYQRLIINDVISIITSNFTSKKPTIVIVHGWLSNKYSVFNTLIKDAYLQNYDGNVIVFDWRSLASSSYVTAVNGVPGVGRSLGEFLKYLNRVTGAPFNTMHLVGFSLGAHLVGVAGRELGGRIARVTGLDPAGPLWNFNANRLNSSAAKYVEAIHTDGSILGLGIGTQVAHVDFFPNGGKFQPGCFMPVCNHNRAFEFFAATVTYNHLVGRQCANKFQVAKNKCRGSYLHMGNADLKKTGFGLYRVNTKRAYPF